MSLYDSDVCFEIAQAWVLMEHEKYQVGKTPPEIDDRRTALSPEEWDKIIDMYLHRARTLGLDNPLGRQAVAKAAATAMGYLESVLRLHETVPEPGVPSGEAHTFWTVK